MPSEPTEQAPSYAELAALVASLRVEVAELREGRCCTRRSNAELEKHLDEARRSNKRQAAPFSKGAPALRAPRAYATGV